MYSKLAIAFSGCIYSYTTLTIYIAYNIPHYQDIGSPDFLNKISGPAAAVVIMLVIGVALGKYVKVLIQDKDSKIQVLWEARIKDKDDIIEAKDAVISTLKSELERMARPAR